MSLRAQDETAENHTPLSSDDFKSALATVTPHLRAFARSLCGCRDRADDLAQETLLKAWGARDRYQSGTNFKAWTFTILRNQFYSEARRGRFHGEYDEVAAERILSAPASQEKALELADVLRAFDLLSENQREVLILAGVGGMSYEEIAEICGIAQGTVKSRICRARMAIEKVLENGQLPDSRHDFVIVGCALQTLFAELATVANARGINRIAA